MSEDLIRRNDAIEFAKYTHIASLNEEERVAWIMNIPTAEPKRGEWIPCSERLPNSSGEYLVTEGAEQKITSIGYYSAEHKRFYSAMDVIAWMPLPKPYGERREP